MESTITTSGTYDLAVFPDGKASISSLAAFWPGFRTTTSSGRSSHLGCLSPPAGACATARRFVAKVSVFIEEIHAPPELTTALDRAATVTIPSRRRRGAAPFEAAIHTLCRHVACERLRDGRPGPLRQAQADGRATTEQFIGKRSCPKARHWDRPQCRRRRKARKPCARRARAGRSLRPLPQRVSASDEVVPPAREGGRHPSVPHTVLRPASAAPARPRECAARERVLSGPASTLSRPPGQVAARSMTWLTGCGQPFSGPAVGVFP